VLFLAAAIFGKKSKNFKYILPHLAKAGKAKIFGDMQIFFKKPRFSLNMP